jgi:NAD(P)-dependent dehydrogenase (short-subunit alcohol dehydrogenase family)
MVDSFSTLSLDGKVGIVFGSATGIGATTARLLARRGASITLADIAAEAANAVAAQIQADGGKAHSQKVDVADGDAVASVISDTVAAFGGLDIIHANAASMGPDVFGVDNASDAVDVPLEVWQRTLDVNLTGALLACRHGVPELRRRGGGAIVLTASVSGLLGEHRRVAYGVSKAGITQLARHVAVAYGKDGIRCNAVCPGLTLTPERELGEEIESCYLRMMPSPRPGRTDDIAELVAFLASDAAGYITAQTIAVDGGLSGAMPPSMNRWG